MTRAIVFDLDGTLVDSAEGILLAFRKVFADAGIEPVRPLSRGVIGPPLRRTLELLTDGAAPAMLDMLAARFREAYDGALCAQASAYPGIDALLRQLHAADTPLFIATNKRTVPTLRIVEARGWATLFGDVRCSDAGGAVQSDKRETLATLVRERGIDRGASLMVGDSIDDAEAAQRAGLRFIGVRWGYGSAALAERHPGLRLVASATELAQELCA